MTRRIRVVTEPQPTGGYTASYDGPSSLMGWGKTELEAIAYLRDQLLERGLISL